MATWTALAERLQIGDRHLRRLFRQHIGAAPVTVAQTRRVLLAKQLIHQTNLSMIQVALASGFGSVRRFNETFQNLYHRPPAQLRRRSAATRSLSPKTSLLLTYRPPYDWHSMLSFLKARAIEGLEYVTEGSYSRVIEIGGTVGSIEISDAPENAALRVTVHFPQLSALPAIITRIRRMFDLTPDPLAIGKALGADPSLPRMSPPARACACPEAGNLLKSPSGRSWASRSPSLAQRDWPLVWSPSWVIPFPRPSPPPA